jgi:hypothetical protein
MVNTNDPIKNLLSVCPAAEWKDFLFDLQSELINNSYVSLLTDIGTSDFVVKLHSLHDFFIEIEKQKEY